ncbi:hypothetical protein HJD18_16345 [Thermoleophilia bacterium SCSIO 60948]|nr:hypothetical protein HJD18_16345 [Thermoleophilia bacterium SCSIO 60948]
MKRSRRDDPALALAVIAALIGLLGWQLISQLRAEALARDLASLIPAAGVVALLAGALVLIRTVATRLALRTRVTLLVVPADEFDPSPESILRFAAQLSRVRRSVRGWLDRRASAVRIQLETNPEGQLLYLLEVPARAEGILRSALRSFEGIELRQPDSPGQCARPAAARAELVLARASVEPLARIALEPDPLQSYAAAVGDLDPACERATVCVDLLPAGGGESRRLRRRLLREARREYGEQPLPLLQLPDQRSRKAEPDELAERRAATRALDAKLKDSGPLFALQVLVRCEARTRAAAKASLPRLLAAFEQLTDRNWLRVSGVPLPGLGFAGSDLPLRRRRFDRRLRTGHFRPARRSVVSAREVAGFLKPPTVHCLAENVLRSGALVAAPPDLPAFTGEPDQIPLGRIAGEQGERVVGVRVADTFFSYCAGRSRYGKTELAVAQFLHLARSGHGGLFLDPHEDAVARIKRHLNEPGLRERVIEIDLAGPGARERQPAWNLFELRGDAEGRVEAVVDAFASALRWDERNTRAINITTQAAQALAHVARSVPPELCPTVFQLPTLLSDEDWRRACLPVLPAASQAFWLDRFPRLAEEAITPVTNLIDRLRASTAITALLGQSESSYRIREAMDRRQIVLACPGSGGTRDRLVANLLVFDLLHAAKGRAELPPAERTPFWVFLDEVQTYDGASSGNLAALLEQTAKYGVRAFLLNQNPERLTAQTLNAVTTNRSHLLTTALNAKAAGLIAKEWAGDLEPAAVARLPRYRFLCQVTHRGALSKPFALRGMRVEDLIGDPDPGDLAELERAVDRTSSRRPAADALAHLETLDERIKQALGEHRRSSGSPAPDREAPAPSRRGGLRVRTKGGDR